MSSKKFHLYATTASVAAITATGALYGAGINIRQEMKQNDQETSQVITTMTPSERLSQLEDSKKKLVRQREELRKKIRKLEEDSGEEEEGNGNGKVLRER